MAVRTDPLIYSVFNGIILKVMQMSDLLKNSSQVATRHDL